jgi:beta-lactam-binding protein with PASTA domain
MEEQPNYMGSDNQISYPVMVPNAKGMAYEQARQALNALSLDEKGQLADEMGVLEDFPIA